jgi:hypothetical protein
MYDTLFLYEISEKAKPQLCMKYIAIDYGAHAPFLSILQKSVPRLVGNA